MNTDENRSELTGTVIREFYGVYNELGCGFLESVYAAAFAMALRSVGLRVEREVEIPVSFRGAVIGKFFADMVIDGVLLVELKALNGLTPTHQAQVMNYLRATNIELALLLNFGSRPEMKRLIYTNDRKKNLCSSV